MQCLWPWAGRWRWSGGRSHTPAPAVLSSCSFFPRLRVSLCQPVAVLLQPCRQHSRVPSRLACRGGAIPEPQGLWLGRGCGESCTGGVSEPHKPWWLLQAHVPPSCCGSTWRQWWRPTVTGIVLENRHRAWPALLGSWEPRARAALGLRMPFQMWPSGTLCQPESPEAPHQPGLGLVSPRLPYTSTPIPSAWESKGGQGTAPCGWG